MYVMKMKMKNASDSYLKNESVSQFILCFLY